MIYWYRKPMFTMDSIYEYAPHAFGAFLVINSRLGSFGLGLHPLQFCTCISGCYLVDYEQMVELSVGTYGLSVEYQSWPRYSVVVHVYKYWNKYFHTATRGFSINRHLSNCCAMQQTSGNNLRSTFRATLCPWDCIVLGWLLLGHTEMPRYGSS